VDTGIKKSVPGIVVLLGSPNSDQGELYSVAQDRCKRAILEYRRRPGWKILPTGGFGAHFNTTDKPHAHYLKEYLIAHGIPDSDILEFALSRNTIEDATLSYPIITKHGVDRALVVTSDYHGDRARYVFQREYRDITLTFALCPTDERTCELDLVALKAHEKKALAKLKRQDIQSAKQAEEN
jgi:uncharacterized SAM-binding protein YcdF (DUF218 family)